MPGMDGTGPRGTGLITGRGFGRFRFGPVYPEAIPLPVQAREDAPITGAIKDQILPETSLSGAGRGKIPCGCRRGRVYAKGRCWY